MYRFGRPTVEWRPGDRPILDIEISSNASTEAARRADVERSFPVVVYRLPSEQAGKDAIVSPRATRLTGRSGPRLIRSRPTASSVSSPSTRRPRAKATTARHGSGSPWPSTAAGISSRRQERRAGSSQMVLQVTTVAAYVAASKDRLLVWANDTSTGKPVQGATVEVDGGATIGKTGSDGLLMAATPGGDQQGGDDARWSRLPARSSPCGAAGGASLLILVGQSDNGGTTLHLRSVEPRQPGARGRPPLAIRGHRPGYVPPERHGQRLGIRAGAGLGPGPSGARAETRVGLGLRGHRRARADLDPEVPPERDRCLHREHHVHRPSVRRVPAPAVVRYGSDRRAVVLGGADPQARVPAHARDRPARRSRRRPR